MRTAAADRLHFPFAGCIIVVFDERSCYNEEQQTRVDSAHSRAGVRLADGGYHPAGGVDALRAHNVSRFVKFTIFSS